MATAEHKTELGSLKASLEWSKAGPNHWRVEGHEIFRITHRSYDVRATARTPHSARTTTLTTTTTLTEAFRYVAEIVESR